MSGTKFILIIGFAAFINLINGSPLGVADLNDEENQDVMATFDDVDRTKRENTKKETNNAAASPGGEAAGKDTCDPIGHVPDKVAFSIGGAQVGELDFSSTTKPLKEGIQKVAAEQAKDKKEIHAHGLRLNELDAISIDHDQRLKDLLAQLQQRARQANEADAKAIELKKELAEKAEELKQASEKHDALDKAHKGTKAGQDQLKSQLEKEVASRQKEIKDLIAQGDERAENLQKALEQIDQAIKQQEQEKEKLNKDLAAQKDKTSKAHQDIEKDLKKKNDLLEKLLDAKALAESERLSLQENVSQLWDRVKTMDARFMAELDKIRAEFDTKLKQAKKDIANKAADALVLAANALREDDDDNNGSAGSAPPRVNPNSPEVRNAQRAVLQIIQFPADGSLGREGAKLQQLSKAKWLWSVFCKYILLKGLWTSAWCFFFPKHSSCVKKEPLYVAAIISNTVAHGRPDGVNWEEVFSQQVLANGNLVSIGDGRYVSAQVSQ